VEKGSNEDSAANPRKLVLTVCLPQLQRQAPELWWGKYLTGDLHALV
jgi:hypothetical protein